MLKNNFTNTQSQFIGKKFYKINYKGEIKMLNAVKSRFIGKTQTTNTSNYVKMQSAVLLYMLNIGQGKVFEVECNGKRIFCKSGENGLVKFKEEHHNRYGLKVTNKNETLCFMEPIFVESFPDNNHILSFHCNDIKITKFENETKMKIAA